MRSKLRQRKLSESKQRHQSTLNMIYTWQICDCCGVQCRHSSHENKARILYTLLSSRNLQLCGIASYRPMIDRRHTGETPRSRTNLSSLNSLSLYFSKEHAAVEFLLTSGHYYLPTKLFSSQICHPPKGNRKTRNYMRKPKTVRYSKGRLS